MEHGYRDQHQGRRDRRYWVWSPLLIQHEAAKMIHLEMTVHDGHIKLKFEIPHKEEDPIRMDELAIFGLHLDVVKDHVVQVLKQAATNNGAAKVDMNIGS